MALNKEMVHPLEKEMYQLIQGANSAESEQQVISVIAEISRKKGWEGGIVMAFMQSEEAYFTFRYALSHKKCIIAKELLKIWKHNILLKYVGETELEQHCKDIEASKHIAEINGVILHEASNDIEQEHLDL